ncbi:MAG: hypothetical protein EPO01_12225 [Aquabacterium sp.]|nr:MAG: hypothetical protein EPO01_12225 [Aquabacterium sp.]
MTAASVRFRSRPRYALWGASLAAVAVLAVLGWVGWRQLHCADCGVEPSAAVREGGAAWFDPKVGSQGPAAGASAPRDAASLRRMLQTTGSLRDTEVDGEWPVDAQGRLVPSLLVRRRFEYFIAAGGEVTPQEVAALIEDDARRSLRPPAAAEAMSLLQRYMEARGEASRYKPDTRDAQSMRAALAGVHAARERILGPAWARAFYGEEEAYFETQIQRVELANSGAAGAAQAAEQQAGDSALLTAAGKDPAALREARLKAYGAEATARMESVDAQWTKWNARIDQGRKEVARIRGAANLSPVQKQAQIQAWIEANFSDPPERLRAQGLLAE